MYIKIALILAALLQFGASIIAVSLIKRTKYNMSWILISIGFFLMAFRRLYELILLLNNFDQFKGSLVSSWIAVIISLLLFFGTIYIKQIFNLQKRIDSLRKENETRVLNAIIRTEEDARQKFAKELHDGIGPLLSAIKMSTSAIKNEEMADESRKIVENADKIIDESIAAVKEISNNLSPHILKNHGLQKAINHFTQHINTSDKFDVLVSSNLNGKRFEYNTEVILYRVICELINNTIKHAKASKAEVDLYFSDNVLEVSYNDNGIGLDLENKVEKSIGMGFSNIRSRIKSLNGKLEMISNPGEGLQLKIKIII